MCTNKTRAENKPNPGPQVNLQVYYHDTAHNNMPIRHTCVLFLLVPVTLVFYSTTVGEAQEQENRLSGVTLKPQFECGQLLFPVSVVIMRFPGGAVYR